MCEWGLILRRLAVGVKLVKAEFSGYATQKRMTGANEGFLIAGAKANVVGVEA